MRLGGVEIGVGDTVGVGDTAFGVGTVGCGFPMGTGVETVGTGMEFGTGGGVGTHPFN